MCAAPARARSPWGGTLLTTAATVYGYIRVMTEVTKFSEMFAGMAVAYAQSGPTMRRQAPPLVRERGAGSHDEGATRAAMEQALARRLQKRASPMTAVASMVSPA